MTEALSPAEVKACCATGYSSDVIRLLLGDSYHPGGLTLTRRVLDLLRLVRGERVADVASGLGTSALLAAHEYGTRVDGVDLSEPNVVRASSTAAERGLGTVARFHHGDAEALPLAAGAYDAVLCECALCTFPDKASAAAEFARVLRPGGRVGISDIAADQSRLPEELRGIAAWVACIADARPATEYAAILTEAGLRVATIESHTEALERMVSQIEARLEVLRMTASDRLAEIRIDAVSARPVLAAARAAIADGILDYIVITAVKP